MAQSKAAKIMAILALAGIVISIVGTGIIFFMGNSSNQKKQISQEELQELLNQQKIEITNSGVTK